MAELNELIKINEKLGKLIELNVKEALETKWLRKGQLKTNKRLGEIVDYKEQQKQGDIRFRKGSTAASMFSIGISLTALYISITGLDGTGVRFVISLFKGLL